MQTKNQSLDRKQRRALFAQVVADLRAERDELKSRLGEIEEELAQYNRPNGKQKPRGSGKQKSRASRTQRAGSLKSMIESVLDASGKTIAQITEAVGAAGYQSKSKTLEKSVSIACSQLLRTGRIQRLSRGVYASA